MSKTSTYIWAVVVIAIVIVGGVLLSRQSANGPETAQDAVGTLAVKETGPLTLGVIAPLTGDGASYGVALQKAYDLAVEEINKAGGVDGREVKLVYQDGKCNGADATGAAQQLINIEKVKFIFGGACSGETLAAAEVTQPAGVLLITASATNPSIANSGDLVFRTYPHDAFEATLMAKYASETLKYKKAALISEQTDFAQGVRKAFQENWKGEGQEIVFDEAFNTGETDFRTLVTKLKASGAEFLYVIPQANAAGELILKQVDEAGVKIAIFGANPLLSRDAFVAKPALYEGMILSEVPLDETATVTKAFLDAFQAKYNVKPDFTSFSAAARDSVYLVIEAIRSVGEDPRKAAEYLNTQIKDWPGAIGTFNFDANGDAVVALSLVQVKNGELVPLK